MLEMIKLLLTICILYNYGIKDRQRIEVNRKAKIDTNDY